MDRGCSQGCGGGVAIAVVGWGVPLGEDGGRSGIYGGRDGRGFGATTN